MGLGKTAQSIAVLEHIRQFCGNRGPFLVIAPLSTLGHWQREVETWTTMVRGAARPGRLASRPTVSARVLPALALLRW
jgi:SNF2 family DNA or RNA helicase